MLSNHRSPLRELGFVEIFDAVKKVGDLCFLDVFGALVCLCLVIDVFDEADSLICIVVKTLFDLDKRFVKGIQLFLIKSEEKS